jgi:hypothetical protein
VVIYSKSTEKRKMIEIGGYYGEMECIVKSALRLLEINKNYEKTNKKRR